MTEAISTDLGCNAGKIEAGCEAILQREATGTITSPRVTDSLQVILKGYATGPSHRMSLTALYANGDKMK